MGPDGTEEDDYSSSGMIVYSDDEEAPYLGTSGSDIKHSYPGYNLYNLLGKGHFGEVWRGERISDSQEVAIKIIRVNPENKKQVETLKREVEILKLISKDGCQPYLACIYDSQYYPERREFIIVMELVTGANLSRYVWRLTDPKTKYRHLLLILKDIIKPLKYLHQNGIIHNDVKGDNIIITPELTPVLVDFGVACLSQPCEVKDFLTRCCKSSGPVLYTSPETVKTGRYYPQSDIWSLGITFYRAASDGAYPFVNQIRFALFPEISEGTPAKLETSNEVLNYIVNRCLDKNMKTRITLDEMSKILEDI